MAGLFIALGLTILLAISKGSVHIPFHEILAQENRPILLLRLLRVLLAAVAGSGLAVSGLALQATLKNPLAEPYLLGASSGAGIGVVLGLILGLAGAWLPLLAFLGSLATVGIVYRIALRGQTMPTESLILAGVVVSVSLSGIIIFLVSFFEDKTLHNLMWWLWGNLQIYSFKLLSIVCLTVISGISVIFYLAQDLNALTLGEEDALHLGINPDLIKKIILLITSLITASLVCICGIIGFVGLIVPHATRILIGPDHKTLIPACVITASIFMILCDLLSRTLFPPYEIPIGVITAVVGGAVFIALLKSKSKETAS